MQDDTMNDNAPDVLASGRRGLLTGAAAAVLGGLTLTPWLSRSAEAAITDPQILNFALNLEYLEAEYYLRGVFGTGLDDSATTGQGTRGGVTGGRKVAFSSTRLREHAAEIAQDEKAHVLFLR